MITDISEADVSTLFEGDEEFERQTEESKEFEHLREMQAFVHYKVQSGCYCCHYQRDGECHLMDRYNEKPFAVTEIGKCKHYLLRKEQ